MWISAVSCSTVISVERCDVYREKLKKYHMHILNVNSSPRPDICPDIQGAVWLMDLTKQRKLMFIMRDSEGTETQRRPQSQFIVGSRDRFLDNDSGGAILQENSENTVAELVQTGFAKSDSVHKPGCEADVRRG
jgi:hypothetical protein